MRYLFRTPETRFYANKLTAHEENEGKVQLRNVIINASTKAQAWKRASKQKLDAVMLVGIVDENDRILKLPKEEQ